MADNLDEPFSAVQLAKSAGLSVRQVERLFLRHLTVTPGRYYMRLRLERARELLRQTNMPILDVAIATGFTSHSYFAQSYRLQFGRPPSRGAPHDLLSAGFASRCCPALVSPTPLRA